MDSNQRLVRSTLTLISQIVENYQKDKSTAFTLGASISDPDDFEASEMNLFQHQFTVAPPTEKERRIILQELTRQIALSSDVRIRSLALQTAAFTRQHLVQLISLATESAFERLKRYTHHRCQKYGMLMETV